jgi:hypothetical protein
MKKYLLIGVLAAVFAFVAVSFSVLADGEYATVYHPETGHKKVVKVGDPLAFQGGYLLWGAPVGLATKAPLSTTGTLTVGGESQLQRVIQGGSITNASSSLNTAMTLTAAQVCNSSLVTVNNAATASFAAVASLDITMPATSTLFADCLDTNGDSISFIFVNASPTAASSTEMIAGTGCESFKSQDTGGADTVPGLGAVKITFLRATDYMGVNAVNDCIMTVEPYIYD